MTDEQELRLPWFEKTAASPNVPDGFEGVLFDVAERLSLRQTGGRIPLHGAVRLKESTLHQLGIQDRHPVRAVVVGVIVGGSNQPCAGNAVLQAPLFPAPAGAAVTEYFSVDLVECTGMPRTPGVFFLFASVGTFTAAPRRIEVVA
jgi:hypothetical protein